MKVLNVSESTIYLDDINIAVIYSRKKKPFEIENRIAKKSKNLRWALKKGLLVDVTKGVPDVLPKPAQLDTEIAVPPPEIEEPESLYERRKSLLSTADPVLPSDAPPKPKPTKMKKAIEEYKETGQMSVVWTGPVTDAGGYANMNRQFMFGLRDLGVNLKYDALASMNDMDAGTNDRLRTLRSARVPSDAPKIYGMTAPLIYDWARYKCLFTMMETRHLHPDYVERCNCADEIVVPSRWCKKTFEESGVKRPISVVPLGVDTKIYHPDAEPLGFSSTLKDYVFLSVFGWSMRKGYDVLLKAYLEEFTGDEPVSLLISSRYYGSTDESKKKIIRDDIARVSATVQNRNRPHLVLFGDVLPIDMMPRLYASADCYVLPSRGEGFGLPFCEAGACRMPVIATNYSGQTDFLDDENSYLVEIDGFARADTDLAWISYFYEDAEFPILGDGVVQEFRRAMRSAYENRDIAEQKAGKLYEKVVNEYDWSVCVGSMRDHLKSIFERVI